MSKRNAATGRGDTPPALGDTPEFLTGATMLVGGGAVM